MLHRTGSLRPKGGTRMTVAELKRKLSNSPYAPLQVRIIGRVAASSRRRRPPSAAACVQCRRERIPCDTPPATAPNRCPQEPRPRDAARPRRLRDAALRRAFDGPERAAAGDEPLLRGRPRRRGGELQARRQGAPPLRRPRREGRRGLGRLGRGRDRAARASRASAPSTRSSCSSPTSASASTPRTATAASSATARSRTTRRSSCSRGPPSATSTPAPTPSRRAT